MMLLNAKVKLFISAMTHVALVAMNMVFLTSHNIVMLGVTGFLISLIWTFNVKKVAFGTWMDRIVYSCGACTGTLSGYYLATYLTHL